MVKPRRKRGLWGRMKVVEKVDCKFCGKGSGVEKEFLIHHVLTIHPNEPEVKEWLKGFEKGSGGG